MLSDIVSKMGLYITVSITILVLVLLLFAVLKPHLKYKIMVKQVQKKKRVKRAKRAKPAKKKGVWIRLV